MIKHFAALFLLLMSVHLGWDASSGATGYYVYYGTQTGVYTQWEAGNVTEFTLATVDETQPMFFAVKAYNGVGLSAFSDEITCKVVTTTIPAIGGAIAWLPVQAVESGGNHTLTVTPTAGYKMSAYKIGSTWTDNPASNDITFTAISENKTVDIVIQRIPTARP